MNYMTKKSIMDRLQEHYNIAKDKADGEIFAIFLQGSQNYIDDLFFEGSDVDSRAIYLPNMKNLCLGIDISRRELILENEEHIDRFDVRKFLKLVQTPGVNNYENLFTEYVIVNPKYQSFYDRLVAIREDIVRIDEKKFLMATSGLSKRDMLSLQKRTGGEDYDIENLGYSRKRLSNIIRFNETIKAYVDNKPFSECLKSMDQELIYKIRRTEHYTLEEALEIAEQADSNSNGFAQARKEVYDSLEVMNTKRLLEEIFVDLMTAGVNSSKEHIGELEQVEDNSKDAPYHTSTIKLSKKDIRELFETQSNEEIEEEYSLKEIKEMYSTVYDFESGFESGLHTLKEEFIGSIRQLLKHTVGRLQ